MGESNLSVMHYQKMVICRKCGVKFRALHGLRCYCETCKPPTKGGVPFKRQ